MSTTAPNIMCKCNLPSQLKTSRTPANPDRPFFTCYYPMNDLRKCNFFKWADAVTSIKTADPVTSMCMAALKNVGEANGYTLMTKSVDCADRARLFARVRPCTSTCAKRTTSSTQ